MNKKRRVVRSLCFAPLFFLVMISHGAWPADAPPQSAPKPLYRAMVVPIEWVAALNNHGDVVGTDRSGNLLLWHKNRLQVLASRNATLNGKTAFPTGLSDDGRITGRMGDLFFTWEKGRFYRGGSRIGREFDNKGRRVGAEFIGKEIVAPALNYSTDEYDQKTHRANHAVLYDGSGRTVDLGVLPGMDWSKAAAVNEKGQVAGTSGALLKRAFVWQNGAMQWLGTLPNIAAERVATVAADINEMGQIVGEAQVSGEAALGNELIAERTAFLWQKGEMVDLDTITQLPPKAHLWEGLAINDKGQILAHGDDGEDLCNFLLTPIKQKKSPGQFTKLPGLFIFPNRRATAFGRPAGAETR